MAGAWTLLSACGRGSPDGAPSDAVTSTATDSATGAATPTSGAPDVVDPASLPSYDYEERELAVVSQGETMAGRLYAPAVAGPVPLVVCSHGLVGSIDDLDPVARTLAGLGLASYRFAFRNGGPEAGDTTRMSVMTEVADLEAVLTAARSAADGWDVVDPQRIVLQGVSQGGAVSTITAARHPEEVAGLALWYPAFSITEDLHHVFTSLDEVPQSVTLGGYSLGRIYAEDMWDYDVYADMPRYSSPVLIVHGTADATAPISYSERAEKTFPDRAMGGTAAYLQRIGVLGG